MTFLQPWVLVGLPLVLAPIIIHLLNRLRHRPQPWAAMRFLIAATRSSASNNRLRQILILGCRVLAVAALVLFMARPLAGGWLGLAVSPAPDAILILLDRSASMETSTGGVTKRHRALDALITAARPFEETSHLVLIDSATRQPQDIARAGSLAQLSLTRPTDTAADIPAMLRAAYNWLIENRAGTAEIWIASDGQRSNWQPDDARWKNVIAQLGGLSQKVRVRLLTLSQAPEANASVRLTEIMRKPVGARSELQFVLEVQRNRNESKPIPLTLTLDGERSDMEIALAGESLRWRPTADLGTRKEGGWGGFTLPADANARDNTAYFVYGADMPLKAVVVSGEADTARFLQFAAAGRKGQPAALTAPGDFSPASLTGCSLVVWQAPLPDDATGEILRMFANEGGEVIFFPPGQGGGQGFNGLAWGNPQSSETEAGYHVSRWDEDEGPLAKSDEHQSLPLAQSVFLRRQNIAGQKNIVAAFEDGAAFLVRESVGKGEVYFCASLPDPAWSSLGDGPVLVPMLQRLLLAGGRRFQAMSEAVCGELSAVDQARPWVSVDSAEAKDIRTQAGVYRSGDRMIAVNRPAAEDDPEIVDSDQCKKLFGQLPVQSFEETGGGAGRMEGEIWRVFLFAMLLLLMAEGFLILPPRGRAVETAGRPTVPQEEGVAA